MRKFILAALCASLQAVYAQKAPEPVVINLEDNMNFQGFEGLEQSLKGRRVFMSGENHSYVELNSRLELKLLRYFHQKAGVRHFILELGPARAHFVNRYINAADTMAEKYLMATTSPRYMKLFKRLKKWNLTLPDTARIIVHGVDVERFNDLPLLRLAELLPDSGIPAGLRSAVDAVHNAAGWLLDNGIVEYNEAANPSISSITRRQPFYIVPTIREFIRFYDSMRPGFRQWLGPEDAAADEAVRWLKEYTQWKDYDNTTFQYVWREENIYRNMVGLLDADPSSRFYGQFGRCHSAYEEQNGECGWYAYHSVISRLRQRYFASDTSVLAIGVFYNGYSEWGGSGSSEEQEKIKDEIRSLFKAAEGGSLSLFDLRDPSAELPLLSKRFSYAITEKDYSIKDDESEDSAVSDTAGWDMSEWRENADQMIYYYGVSVTDISRSELAMHDGAPGFQDAGYTYRHSFGTMVLQRGFYLAYGGDVTGRRNFSSSDTDNYAYGLGQFNLEFGYPLVLRRGFHLLAGPGFFWGRQHLKYWREGVDFLQPPGDYVKSVTNPSWGMSMNVRAGLRIAGPFQLGVFGSWQRDFTKGDWYLKGSSEPYAAGRLRTNMSGLNAGVVLNLSVPLD